MHPLWLCLRLPSLPLEALPLPGDGPCAVYERQGSRKRLLCGNPAAEALGLTPGIELGAAAALAPSLRTVERSPRAEREALRALAAAAYRFSSLITAQAAAPAPDAHMLWLEIASSLRLFGGVDALVAQLAQAIEELGYRCEIGIAPTPEGASLLAGCHPERSEGSPCVGERAFDRVELWRALEKLPIARLPVDEATRAALSGSGLRRLGEVLALPLDALARRFSPEFTDWLGRVTGRLPDARRWYRPPALYRRYFEMSFEAETTEALRFPIRRMLGELAAYLLARDVGVSAFTLELAHEDGSHTALETALASPSRDATHLQVLAWSRLEKLVVAAPVTGLVLRAERFAPVRVRQFDLFSTRSLEEDEWQAVLDRLRARLGAAAVQSLGLHADHRPEKSFARLCHPGSRSDEGSPPRQRPLWLLPEPRALAETPHCLRGPERIEAGWWDGHDAQRDDYVAESDGARLWVYKEQRSGRWFLHGLWA